MDKRNKQADKKTDRNKDRGDLRKMTTKKTQEDIKLHDKIPFVHSDRGDAVNRLKNNEFEGKRGTKQSNFKNVSNATVGNEKNTVKAVQKQALSHLDIRKLIRERYTMRQAAIQAAILNNTNDSNGATISKGVHDVVNESIKTNSRPPVKIDRTVDCSKKPIPELAYRSLDKELILRNPNTEFTCRNLVKESTYRNRDKESTYRNLDKEFTYRNQDNEFTYRNQDKNSTYRNLVKESSYRNRDKESTYRNQDKETIYRNQDKESTIRKTDKETIYRKQDRDTISRKPIIKTVTPKNTTKIYKAVTFGSYRDVKPQPRPLQINIPNNEKSSTTIINNKASKSTDTVTLKSRPRVCREKPDIRRKIIGKRIGKTGHHSPDSSKFRKNESPPTEVAKWAPSCVNRHTKPYYEAWVNTTLAAISKSSKKDQMVLEKRSIIQSFQRALEEREDSPELFYEKLKDERYTGRIRVISRHR